MPFPFLPAGASAVASSAAKAGSFGKLLGSAGSFLSGVGSLGGIFGGGGDGIDVSENYRLQSALIEAKVAGAKKAGLHPLFALGGSTMAPVGFSMPGQSSTGSHIQEAGAALERIGGKKARNALAAAQLNAVNASAARDEAAAALDLSRAKREEVEALQKPLPPEDPTKPLYIQARNPMTGEMVWLPNPELNIEMPETIGGAYWARGKLYDSMGNPVKPAQRLGTRKKRRQRRRGQQQQRR